MAQALPYITAAAAVIGAGTAVHTATSGKKTPKLPKTAALVDPKDLETSQMRKAQRKYAGVGRKGTNLTAQTALG